MKKIIITLIGMVFLLVIIPSVLSEIDFWQVKHSHGNGTIVQNYLVSDYSKNGYLFNDDYVTGNNPYIVYLLYNIYPKKYNQDNPTDKVINCSWIIRKLTSGDPIILINTTYTENDSDIMNAKYFVQLQDGEGLTADQTCYFQNASTELSLPAEMQLVAPTWECKSCQQYEWTLIERNVDKAQTLGDNVVTITEYIKKLFLINFEIWLALFWIFLIMCIFMSISFIFWGIYFVFLYLRRLAK
jgi:hypothetical protein